MAGIIPPTHNLPTPMSPSHWVKFWWAKPPKSESRVECPAEEKWSGKHGESFSAEASIGCGGRYGRHCAHRSERRQDHRQDPGAATAGWSATRRLVLDPPWGRRSHHGTFVEAEKLVQVQMKDAELAQAASSWRGNMASLYERRTGPRKIALESNPGSFFPLQERHARAKSARRQKSIRAQQKRSRPVAVERCGHRLRFA